MHELATNAAKYGALSTETGVVDVCWEVEPNHQLSIVGPNGRPGVTPPRATASAGC